MFRTIVITAFVKNRIRKGNRKMERVGQDVSAGHLCVRRTGERPPYILRWKPTMTIFLYSRYYLEWHRQEESHLSPRGA